MILTPIAAPELGPILERFAVRLAGNPRAAAAFGRIRATWPVTPGQVDTPAQRAEGIRLAHAFGIETLDEEPENAFMWDGRCIRTRIEATVIAHEVAHWLLCAPERRPLPDFGLGSGPSTGRRDIANAAFCVSLEERETEEVLTSLLGILWEAELGQPAILGALEQNWLEGADRDSTAAFFAEMLERLYALGHVDAEGRPCPPPARRAAA